MSTQDEASVQHERPEPAGRTEAAEAALAVLDPSAGAGAAARLAAPANDRSTKALCRLSVLQRENRAPKREFFDPLTVQTRPQAHRVRQYELLKEITDSDLIATDAVGHCCR
jgi:hypothetical protein